MLKSIKIKNFKSIDEEIELSFEPVLKNSLDEYYLTKDKLLKTAIIYGANASGKTNIIKAIEFLREFIFEHPKDREEKINIAPFLFKDEIKENSKFILEFIEDNFLFEYELKLNKKQVVFESLKAKDTTFKKARFATVFKREYEKISWGSKIKISKNEKEIIKLNTLANNSVLSGYLRVNLKIDEMEFSLKFFKKILPPVFPVTNLLGYGLGLLEDKKVSKDEVIKILKNADFAIDDFDIKEQDVDEEFAKFLEKIGKAKEIDNFKKIEIWFKHYQKYQLEFEHESRGTQRFYQLAIFLALLAKNSYIVAIDEIESALHPDLLKFFILIFLTNSKNSQIVLTTHTRELLLEKDILRKDVVWFCEKKNDGSTDLYSLNDFGSQIKENSSIYNYYKQGKLGAIPNIKNFIGLLDEKK